MRRHFQPGEWVIYRKHRYSVRPRPPVWPASARKATPQPIGMKQEIAALWVLTIGEDQVS
jgi:hypothetical protein